MPLTIEKFITDPQGAGRAIWMEIKRRRRLAMPVVRLCCAETLHDGFGDLAKVPIDVCSHSNPLEVTRLRETHEPCRCPLAH
jgi:hypothetical protein